ncbi:hypothetical protein B0H67DRAFT_389369 [Lasiosphaeris hirsuta]|uniref:Hsp70 family protein n=1 Tax=Lasiosphaeris hirsuta TaxID=260670 RepID=A0AA39ZY01_9PEZI|nr:hypothetical protein B0H67DRAFT_389369 [Lasiosphaeris hirsuta]
MHPCMGMLSTSRQSLVGCFLSTFLNTTPPRPTTRPLPFPRSTSPYSNTMSFYSRQPARRPSQRGADSMSMMSGETALNSQAPSESAFGSVSQRPWMPELQIPMPRAAVPEPSFYSGDSAVSDTSGPGPGSGTTGLGPGDTGSDETRVMLGLDYGTTYTGLAYMHQTVEADPSFRDLRVFGEWSGGGGAGKIPSAISYSKTPSKCKQWGDDIDKQQSLVLKWTKLELQPQKALQELAKLREALGGLALVESLLRDEREGVQTDMPLHITKSPISIVQDYLTRVARHYYLYMRNNSEFAFERGNVPVDMVITHPAGWPYEALNKTFRATMGAFHKKMFPTRRNVYLVPEPEACAVFTVQDMITSGENNMVPGECFVVCDAGGGTVDLVTYRFDRLEPLELEKIGPVSGDYCGATFIDRAFLKWIESKITNIDMRAQEHGTGGHFVHEAKRNTILDRFEKCKRQFTGTETNILTMPRGIQGDPAFTQLANGQLTITADDMRGFFRFSIQQTLDLIDRQVGYARVQGETVSYIFMSGGMSQSEYVLDQVQEWAATHYGDVAVQRPQEGWTAVAQGGVLCAMGIGANNAVLGRPSPQHYGISGPEALSPWKHRDAGIKLDADAVHGGNMALEQITWLVRKGDLVLPDRPVEAACRVACTFLPAQARDRSTVRVTFCATDLEHPPGYGLDGRSDEVATIEIRIAKIPASAHRQKTSRGREYLKATMDVKIFVFYDGRVEVKVFCEGNQLGAYPPADDGPEKTGRRPAPYAHTH